MDRPDPRLLRRTIGGPDYALDLMIRTSNALKRAEITTLGDLASKSFIDVLDVRGIGMTGLIDIFEELAKKNLELKPHKHFNGWVKDENGKPVPGSDGHLIPIVEDWYLQDMLWFQLAYKRRTGRDVTPRTTPTQEGESA